MEAVEITHIRDEDVLRNMWHRTEDFGRKKEIRAHMYRLREERLRNLYVADMADVSKMSSSTTSKSTVSKSTSAVTSADVAQQTTAESMSNIVVHEQEHRSSTIAADEVLSTVVKHSAAPSHENLLADQSYQSLKTKEVRDSESPTSDRRHRSAIAANDRSLSLIEAEKAMAAKAATTVHVERHVDHPDEHTEIVTEQRQLRDGRRLLTKNIESHHGDANSTRDYSEQNVLETNIVGNVDDGSHQRTLKTATAALEITTTNNNHNGDETGDQARNHTNISSSSTTTTISTTSTMSTNSAHDYFVRTLRSPSSGTSSQRGSQSTSPTRRTTDGSPQVSSRGSSVSPQRHSRASPGSSRSASISPSRKPFYLNESVEGVEVTTDLKTNEQRPPLVRSETYEERCRHILGMANNSTVSSESRRSSADAAAAATVAAVQVDTKSSSSSSSRPVSPLNRRAISPIITATSTPKQSSRPNSPSKRRDISPIITAATTKKPSNSSRPSSPSKRRDVSPPVSASNHISSATIVLSPPAKRRIQKTMPSVSVDRCSSISTNSNSKKTATTTHRNGHHRSTTSAQPVIERKESAPVYGSKSIAVTMTGTDKDDETIQQSVKIVRSSTSDGVMRPFNGNNNPQASSKTGSTTTGSGSNGKSSRPQKCIATKTLNLSPASAGKLATASTSTATKSSAKCNASVDVQIDIQLAKSSREPSPNRIVPTPVSPDEDAADGGPPRYPDTVVEPDDAIAGSGGRYSPTLSRRRGLGRRGTDGGISSGLHGGVSGGCRITEVEIEEACLIVSDVDDEETDIDQHEEAEEDQQQQHHQRQQNTLKNEQLEVSVDANDPSLLSVQDKVLKVLSTTEDAATVHNSNSSSTSQRSPNAERFESNVSGKITQFITIAENMSKQRVSRPFSLTTATTQQSNGEHAKTTTTAGQSTTADLVSVADGDECLLSVSDKISRFTAAAQEQPITTAKIAAALPQKSPKLVATVERKLSRQLSRDPVQAGSSR